MAKQVTSLKTRGSRKPVISPLDEMTVFSDSEEEMEYVQQVLKEMPMTLDDMESHDVRSQNHNDKALQLEDVLNFLSNYSVENCPGDIELLINLSRSTLSKHFSNKVQNMNSLDDVMLSDELSNFNSNKKTTKSESVRNKRNAKPRRKLPEDNIDESETLKKKNNEEKSKCMTSGSQKSKDNKVKKSTDNFRKPLSAIKALARNSFRSSLSYNAMLGNNETCDSKSRRLHSPSEWLSSQEFEKSVQLH